MAVTVNQVFMTVTLINGLRTLIRIPTATTSQEINTLFMIVNKPLGTTLSKNDHINHNMTNKYGECGDTHHLTIGESFVYYGVIRLNIDFML